MQILSRYLQIQLLKKNFLLLLLLLKDYEKYVQICIENKCTWQNFESDIWVKLLKNNGFRDPLPKMSRVIEISHKFKRHRIKNFTIHSELPNQEQIIAKLYRDTASCRHKKHEEFKQILEKFKRKTIHRFYPSKTKRYKNIAKRLAK